jgi:voltage-gated potassium channel
MTTRERIHEVIFEAGTPGGAFFDITLLIAIVLSIIVISLDTVQEISPETHQWLAMAKWFFTGLFTIEYGLRIYCVKRPWKYVTSFWGIVDLLSFLPDYLLLIFQANAHFAVIRSLRLLRAFRIFNLGWFQSEAEDLGDAIWRARAKVVVFLSVVMILVTVTGTLMYEIENEILGEESLFHSIPDGIYWAIVTMTTVGFGDIVPKTVAGKFLSAFLILVGYSLIIVPTGFVSAEVIEAQRRRRLTTISCPSCITEGHDVDAKFCKNCGEEL